MSALAKPQRSLKAWGEQKWTTKSGKKSSETGERYLPKKAIEALSPAKYAATTRAKRAGKAKGKQFVPQPKGIKAKVKPEEYDEYMNVTKRDEEVSKIFGPYGGKIRPDILNWIDKNKEEFKNLVNTLL